MKQRKPVASREAARAEIASLSELGFKELRERWKALYGIWRAIGRLLEIQPLYFEFQTLSLKLSQYRAPPRSCAGKD